MGGDSAQLAAPVEASEGRRLSPAHVTLIRTVLDLMHVLADAQDRVGVLRGQIREACKDSDDPNLLEASETVSLLSLDLDMIECEAVACSVELTGSTESDRSRSLLSAALDLHDLSRSTTAREDLARGQSLYEARQRYAAAHFRRI